MASLSEENHPLQGPMQLDQLRSLVARAPTKEALKSWNQRQRDRRKDDLRSQLFWYGIPYTNSTIMPTLEKLLREAVETNKCAGQTPRILERERREQEAIRLREEAWQKCTNPVERARYSLDRFMNHYFLTDGRPDTTKTTEPLALYGYPNRHEISNRVQRIPGLETTSGLNDSQHVPCIGWDRDAVWKLARSISAKTEEKKAQEAEAEWEAVMEDHRELVASIKQKKAKKGPMSERDKLEKCKGSYVIRCDELSGGWDNCDSLNIDIATGPKTDILEAAVEFGMIEGTMLLAFNEAELDAYVAVASEDSDSDDDAEDNDSEDDDLPPASKKRKAPTKSTAPKAGRGRPKKQAKTGASTSNRLFFRLRGRETGEGEIFSRPHNGYLEFTDGNFVAFKGVGSMPAVGNAVPFEGFKVSPEAAARAEPWSAFSEVAYEEARVSRWH